MAEDALFLFDAGGLDFEHELRSFLSKPIEELAGGKANLFDAPKPAADVVTTYADISKATELLKYEPQVTVQEGVQLFWEWYRENG